MNPAGAAIILALLLFGPLASKWIEPNLEFYCLLLGVAAITLAGGWRSEVVLAALTGPIPISIAVLVAGVLFHLGRNRFDRGFARLRGFVPRPVLTGMMVIVIAMLSSLITAIVAALVLVEAIGLLKIHGGARERVAIAGCFAVGLGAALTPIGEPLSTLAAQALGLGFLGLFELLAPYVIPGIIACSAVAAYMARGDYESGVPLIHARASWIDLVMQAVKVFGFIAGLIFISEAYAPLAMKYLPLVSTDALFWINMASAALDNATLVAVEIHHLGIDRAREAILALLISGGMLIPGNVPNIVSAGALHIRSTTWARLGVPLGLILMALYFGAFKLIG